MIEHAGSHLEVARGSLVVLREKRLADAVDDYAWRCDPELARYDGREPLAEPFSEFRSRFQHDLRVANPREHMLAIDSLGGQHIGNLMYYNAGGDRSEAEFGITIGCKELHGGGYGREATVLFLRHLWETTPFRAVTLHTFEWNARAQACFRGAGFEEAGVLLKANGPLVRMVARREWWMLYDTEGRFERRRSA